MPNKQQILSKIQDMNDLEQELKDAMLLELGSYPEEMTQADLVRFDKYVQDIQEEELESAQVIQEVVDATDNAKNLSTIGDQQASEQVLDVLQTGLNDALAVAGV